jgi:hypothetical protein
LRWRFIGVASCPIQNIDWLSYFGCPTLGPSPHRPVAVIGDENASRAYAFPGMEQRMQQHTRHFKQAAPLNQRLTEEAQRLRKEAKGTAAGFAREQLIRPAPQAETAARMQEWHASHGLLPPR